MLIPLDEEEPLLELPELLELLSLLALPPTSFSISTGGKLFIGMSSPMSTSSSPTSPFFGLLGSVTATSIFSLPGNSYINKPNKQKLRKLHVMHNAIQKLTSKLMKQPFTSWPPLLEAMLLLMLLPISA